MWNVQPRVPRPIDARFRVIDHYMVMLFSVVSTLSPTLLSSSIHEKYESREQVGGG